MPLVKNGTVVADDFTRVEDDAALPDGPVLVGAERFLAEAATLLARNVPVGVLWPNNRSVKELEPYIDRLALIALVFPIFRDGRAYTQARILRERYGFSGELRATGNVLRDQFLLMMRAGFNALDVTKEADVAALGQVLKRYSAFYQPTGDGRVTARDIRKGVA